jgi:hypothetical protein
MLPSVKKTFGEKAQIVYMPQRPGLPNALIASWGKVRLEELDPVSLSVVASGGSPSKGILVDFLGDFARSARSGVPVYRVTGGAGYVWSASYDHVGRGHLQFFAMDPSTISMAALAGSPVSTPPRRSDTAPVSESPSGTGTPNETEPTAAKAEAQAAKRLAEGGAEKDRSEAEAKQAEQTAIRRATDAETRVAELAAELQRKGDQGTATAAALAQAEAARRSAEERADKSRSEADAAKQAEQAAVARAIDAESRVAALTVELQRRAKDVSEGEDTRRLAEERGDKSQSEGEAAKQDEQAALQRATNAEAPHTDCDTYAAHDQDPQRKSAGVSSTR